MSFDEVMNLVFRVFNVVAGPVILLSFLIVVVLLATIVLLPAIEVWALAQ